MARTNIRTTRIKPDQAELLTLHVVRATRLSPHFARVTLGGGDVEQFRYMGFDQWFRLFIPVSEHSLAKLPRKLDTLSYARYLTIAKTDRPVLRNYTVRAHRPGELDVDFVIHGPSGPAGTWARTCAPGDAVGVLDEGIGFNPSPEIRRVLLVAEESGLPATAGILASLPADTTGRAVIEVPSEEDRQRLTAPAGVEITWLTRSSGVPGRLALAAARELPVDGPRTYGWVVGEQALASGLRKHWVGAGMAKQDLMFCGYWRHH
ncbi:siderophore-interacting protein [Actinokineospora cianjurensis]|uniref:NADPH-dependent ferric siderophore reductase n=1 Tax=Actinokineospora cianjurensis TaxID=585224 RepID=A0A421B3X4_9PSEU|nr:siderophore-interacting protein [Actinokineospora cianjurensis]RLK58983.1 NADPH-dependent ferric siderophore reductase [Actinokineospora cianjurensis]